MLAPIVCARTLLFLHTPISRQSRPWGTEATVETLPVTARETHVEPAFVVTRGTTLQITLSTGAGFFCN